MDTASQAGTSRSDRVALGIIALSAAGVAVASVAAIVSGALGTFRGDPPVEMPVRGGAAPAVEALPGVDSAVFTSAEVVFAGLPGSVRWLLFAEGALPALATIGVCVVAWWLALALMRSRPFRPAMSNAFGLVACLVLVGGVGGQLLGAIGRAVLVEDLSLAAPEATDVFWIFVLDLDLAPFGWGFALALIAGAFTLGARLQRDTEGLV